MNGSDPIFWVLAVLLIGVPLAIVVAGSRSMLRARSSAMRIFAGAGVVGSIALLCLIGLWVIRVGPGMSGVVASGTSGGREFCVVQTYRGLVEPYQVSLYVRDGAGQWRWHYLGHQDNAWRSARVEIADRQATVQRDGEPAVQLELAGGPAEPEVLQADGYLALQTLSPALTAEDVARWHDVKFRR